MMEMARQQSTNTKPAASDYVSSPFGPGKIYQKQPAV